MPLVSVFAGLNSLSRVTFLAPLLPTFAPEGVGGRRERRGGGREEAGGGGRRAVRGYHPVVREAVHTTSAEIMMHSSVLEGRLTVMIPFGQLCRASMIPRSVGL